MTSINCPVRKRYSSMHAQCEKCGIKMCHGCYCKGASSKCPTCGAIHKVKPSK